MEAQKRKKELPARLTELMRHRTKPMCLGLASKETSKVWLSNLTLLTPNCCGKEQFLTSLRHPMTSSCDDPGPSRRKARAAEESDEFWWASPQRTASRAPTNTSEGSSRAVSKDASENAGKNKEALKVISQTFK